MKKKVLITMVIIWIIFIFFNSLQNAQVSASQSGRVVGFLYDLFTKVGIDVDISTLSTWIRKLAHIFEYFILALLITLIFFETNLPISYKYIYSFTIPLLIAIADEYIQTMVPGRSGLVVDVLIDSIGITLGVGLLMIIRLFRKN